MEELGFKMNQNIFQ